MFKDKILNGIIVGTLLPILFYGGALGLLSLLQREMDYGFYENFQLLCIALNAIVLRHFMVKLKRDQFGKGVFIVTFIMAFAYIIVYYS